MIRVFALLLLVSSTRLVSGCLVVKTAGAVAGTAVGAAGEVAEGAVNVVTPDGDADGDEDEDQDGEEREKR